MVQEATIGIKSKIRSTLRGFGIDVRRVPKLAPRKRAIAEYEVTGEFIDGSGVSHTLYDDFRTVACPRWKRFFAPRVPEVSDAEVKYAARLMDGMVAALASCEIDIKGKRVFEFGCGSGLMANAVLAAGAREVYATDIPDYWARESDDDETDAQGKVREKRQFLDDLRVSARSKYMAFAGCGPLPEIRFGELDITAELALGEEFDIVMSFETIEHIPDIPACMRNTKQLLVEGGATYHHYNPFFSFDGGHSLCTLDFPWGHAQLESTDFRRYIEQYRPKEVELATQFFELSLNRLTQNMLRDAVEDSGLAVRGLCPRINKIEHMVEPHTLARVRACHPTVEIQDLLSSEVELIAVNEWTRKH